VTRGRVYCRQSGEDSSAWETVEGGSLGSLRLSSQVGGAHRDTGSKSRKGLTPAAHGVPWTFTVRSDNGVNKLVGSAPGREIFRGRRRSFSVSGGFFLCLGERRGYALSALRVGPHVVTSQRGTQSGQVLCLLPVGLPHRVMSKAPWGSSFQGRLLDVPTPSLYSIACILLMPSRSQAIRRHPGVS
jgi:hypothetical protein